MKHFPHLLIAILALAGLSSCGSITNELWLEKNGSAILETRMGLGKIMMMMESAKSMDTTGTAMPALRNIDSLIRFADLPEEDRKKMNNPYLVSKGFIKLVLDQEKDTFYTVIHAPVQQLADLNNLQENLKAINDRVTNLALGENSPISGGETAGNTAEYSVEKKTFTRKNAGEGANALQEVLGGGEDPSAAEMMKSIFQEFKVREIYHMPGKIKKTNLKNAKPDGNTLIYEYNLADLMGGKVEQQLEIQFK